LWPELEQLLKATGVHEYSIFLDEETNALFGVMDVEDESLLDKLPEHPVMQKWWKFMSDVMASNPDHSPVSVALKEMFYLK
jgi:L-rhamnose mutarotase